MVFAITRFVPGGPVERMLMESQMQSSEFSQSSRGSQVLSAEQIEELKVFYGLDKPVFEAYRDWLTKLVTLDLGESSRYFLPVWELIKERLPISAFFGVCTFILSYLVSIPLGILKALKHNSRFDSITSMLIYAGYALPAYVVGIFLLTIFSFQLGWFPWAASSEMTSII